jgi:hypothetical protein
MTKDNKMIIKLMYDGTTKKDGEKYYIGVALKGNKTEFTFEGTTKKEVKNKLLNWIEQNKIAVPLWQLNF